MREIPSTYAAWSKLLAELAAGEDDAAVLEAKYNRMGAKE